MTAEIAEKSGFSLGGVLGVRRKIMKDRSGGLFLPGICDFHEGIWRKKQPEVLYFEADLVL